MAVPVDFKITVTRIPSIYPRTRLEPDPMRFFLRPEVARSDHRLRGHFDEALLAYVLPDQVLLGQGAEFFHDLCAAIRTLPNGKFVYHPGGDLYPQMITLTAVWEGFLKARCCRNLYQQPA